MLSASDEVMRPSPFMSAAIYWKGETGAWEPLTVALGFIATAIFRAARASAEVMAVPMSLVDLVAVSA